MKASHQRPRPLWPFIAATGLAWLLVLIFAPSARAEQRCVGLVSALTELQTTYAENILWEGVAGSGQTLILTANPAGATWTLLVQDPSKPNDVCLIAAGASWSAGTTELPPPGKEG